MTRNSSFDEQYVSRAEINDEAVRIGALLRANLLALPYKVAAKCEGQSAENIAKIIDKELRKDLRALRSLFV